MKSSSIKNGLKKTFNTKYLAEENTTNEVRDHIVDFFFFVNFQLEPILQS